MGAASRQVTCAACGGNLSGEVELEVLIDDTVRHVAVHPGHSITTLTRRRRRDERPEQAEPDDLGRAA